jgi:hypothetical protein
MSTGKTSPTSASAISRLIRDKFPHEQHMMVADTAHGVRLNVDAGLLHEVDVFLREQNYVVELHGSSLWISGRRDL